VCVLAQQFADACRVGQHSKHFEVM
jgi:hypothetical protein